MTYYFAYGSNMDEAQMRERCPVSTIVEAASLEGYALAFTIYSPKRKCGCADIVPRADGRVFGVLYALPPDDVARLDAAEGVDGGHYRRVSVLVTGLSGTRFRAEAYEVVRKREDCPPPSTDYMGLLLRAAERFAFPPAYARMLEGIRTSD